MAVGEEIMKLNELIEGRQTLGGALSNALSKAEPGSKLDRKIKTHNRAVKAGLKVGLLDTAPTGYHFKKDGSIALGENICPVTGDRIPDGKGATDSVTSLPEGLKTIQNLKKKPVNEGASVPYTVVVVKRTEGRITIDAVTADQAREIAEQHGYEVIRVEDTGNGTQNSDASLGWDGWGMGGGWQNSRWNGD
jgi:hypothetical protein